MSGETVIDVPHGLGREEARRRMRARVGELAGFIPGGMADVRSSWTGEDEMRLEIAAMGQTLAARLEVQDRLVRVHLALPPMLSFMAGPITAAIRQGGERMLEDRRG